MFRALFGYILFPLLLTASNISILAAVTLNMMSYKKVYLIFKIRH